VEGRSGELQAWVDASEGNGPSDGPRPHLSSSSSTEVLAEAAAADVDGLAGDTGIVRKVEGRYRKG